MLSSILNNFGAVATLLFGVACLIWPAPIAKAVCFELKGARGRAEFRIGFGGFFAGLVGYALWAQNRAVFAALGFMWLGAAITRLAVLPVDKPAFNRNYLIVLIYELTHAALLLA